MRIVVNPKNLVVDDSFQIFYKVRAVIVNADGKYAISRESGKCIFPGGKVKNNEDVLTAIKRELLEEMGINFSDHELLKKFVLETIYDDYYDFRVRGYRARCTITTYFYGETKQDIDTSRMNLTMEEINEEFKISFVSKEDLIKIINTDHSSAFNGRYFDEENKIVYENIIGGLKQ